MKNTKDPNVGLVWMQLDIKYSLICHIHDIEPKCSLDHDLDYNFDIEN
jgi:hypothetical protein